MYCLGMVNMEGLIENGSGLYLLKGKVHGIEIILRYGDERKVICNIKYAWGFLERKGIKGK